MSRCRRKNRKAVQFVDPCGLPREAWRELLEALRIQDGDAVRTTLGVVPTLSGFDRGHAFAPRLPHAAMMECFRPALIRGHRALASDKDFAQMAPDGYWPICKETTPSPNICPGIAALTSLAKFLATAEEGESLISACWMLRDDQGLLPVHYAAFTGCITCLRFLKGSGSPLNLPDSQDRYPAWWAVTNRQGEALRWLLDAVPESVAKPMALGRSLLVKASWCSDPELVSELLLRQADPRQEDHRLRNAVMWALSDGNSDIVHALVDSDSGEEALLNGRDAVYGDRVSVHLAAFGSNDGKLIEWVLQKLVGVNVLGPYLEQRSRIDGQTPLMVAVLKNRLCSLDVLLQEICLQFDQRYLFAATCAATADNVPALQRLMTLDIVVKDLDTLALECCNSGSADCLDILCQASATSAQTCIDTALSKIVTDGGSHFLRSAEVVLKHGARPSEAGVLNATKALASSSLMEIEFDRMLAFWNAVVDACETCPQEALSYCAGQGLVFCLARLAGVADLASVRQALFEAVSTDRACCVAELLTFANPQVLEEAHLQAIVCNARSYLVSLLAAKLGDGVQYVVRPQQWMVVPPCSSLRHPLEEAIQEIEAQASTFTKSVDWDGMMLDMHELPGVEGQKKFTPLPRCPAASSTCPAYTEVRFVDTIFGLQEIVAELYDAALRGGSGVLGVDVEYFTVRGAQNLGFVCLLQLNCPRIGDVVIDALHLRGVAAPILNPLLQDTRIMKLLHGGANDVRWLANDMGIFLHPLLDTQEAHRCCPRERCPGESKGDGLKNVARSWLDELVDKRFQVADWRVRPLPAEMLEYAAKDARLLPRLASRIVPELIASGMMPEALRRSAVRSRAVTPQCTLRFDM